MDKVIIYSFSLIALVLLRENRWLAKDNLFYKGSGMAIRYIIVIMLYPLYSHMLIAANIVWTGYDIVCAKGLGQKWYYLGTTSITDKFVILNYVLKILLLTLTLVYIIVNL